MMSATNSHHDSASPLTTESGVHTATESPEEVLVERTGDDGVECERKSLGRGVRPSDEGESLDGWFVATSDDYYKVITNG